MAAEGEHEEQRAEDFVERPDVAPGPVLRHELHKGPRIAHVEHREVGGHRCREHPEPVGRRSQVGDIEREDQHAKRRFVAIAR